MKITFKRFCILSGEDTRSNLDSFVEQMQNVRPGTKLSVECSDRHICLTNDEGMYIYDNDNELFTVELDDMPLPENVLSCLIKTFNTSIILNDLTVKDVLCYGPYIEYKDDEEDEYTGRYTYGCTDCRAVMYITIVFAPKDDCFQCPVKLQEKFEEVLVTKYFSEDEFEIPLLHKGWPDRNVQKVLTAYMLFSLKSQNDFKYESELYMIKNFLQRKRFTEYNGDNFRLLEENEYKIKIPEFIYPDEMGCHRIGELMGLYEDEKPEHVNRKISLCKTNIQRVVQRIAADTELRSKYVDSYLQMGENEEDAIEKLVADLTENVVAHEFGHKTFREVEWLSETEEETLAEWFASIVTENHIRELAKSIRKYQGEEYQSIISVPKKTGLNDYEKYCDTVYKLVEELIEV